MNDVRIRSQAWLELGKFLLVKEGDRAAAKKYFDKAEEDLDKEEQRTNEAQAKTKQEEAQAKAKQEEAKEKAGKGDVNKKPVSGTAVGAAAATDPKAIEKPKADPNRFADAWKKILDSLGYIWIPIGAVVGILMSEVLKSIGKTIAEGINRLLKIDEKINQGIEKLNQKRSTITPQAGETGANPSTAPNKPA